MSTSPFRFPTKMFCIQYFLSPYAALHVLPILLSIILWGNVRSLPATCLGLVFNWTLWIIQLTNITTENKSENNHYKQHLHRTIQDEAYSFSFSNIQNEKPAIKRISILTKRSTKVLMSFKGLLAAFIACIPNPQALIVTGTHYKFTTRMEYHTTHPIVMAHQCEEAHASAHIPNLQNNKNKCNDKSFISKNLPNLCQCSSYKIWHNDIS